MASDDNITIYPCPRCGASLPPTGSICPYCHTSIEDGHRKFYDFLWLSKFACAIGFGIGGFWLFAALFPDLRESFAWAFVFGVVLGLAGLFRGEYVGLAVYEYFTNNGADSYQTAMDRENSKDAAPGVTCLLDPAQLRCRGVDCHAPNNCLRYAAYLEECKVREHPDVDENLCGAGLSLKMKLLGRSVQERGLG